MNYNKHPDTVCQHNEALGRTVRTRTWKQLTAGAAIQGTAWGLGSAVLPYGVALMLGGVALSYYATYCDQPRHVPVPPQGYASVSAEERPVPEPTQQAMASPQEQPAPEPTPDGYAPVSAQEQPTPQPTQQAIAT